MDKSAFIEAIKNIGTCEDDTQRLELLSALNEEVSKDYDKLTELETSNEALTTDNENLRSANMKLFLRIGESKSDEEVRKDSTGIKEDKETKREFKDLFDEKGGIK